MTDAAARISVKFGDVLTVRRQQYAVILVEPYTRRDGDVTSLATWASECAECGAPFCFSTATTFAKFKPIRRCEAHRRRGKRIKPKRKQRKGDSR